MTISIDFETIEARDLFLQDSPPEGVSFYIGDANEGGVIATTYTLFVEIIKPIAEGVIAAWIYDHAAKHDAKRIQVNGREPADRAVFERFIVSDLEIGKND